LISYSPSGNIAIIEQNGARLNVDTTYLGAFPHREKSLYQMIGELQEFLENSKVRSLTDTKIFTFRSYFKWIKTIGFSIFLFFLFLFILKQDQPEMSIHSIILKARVIRCVDGLDLNLYEKIVSLRRKFNQERAKFII